MVEFTVQNCFCCRYLMISISLGHKELTDVIFVHIQSAMKSGFQEATKREANAHQIWNAMYSHDLDRYR